MDIFTSYPIAEHAAEALAEFDHAPITVVWDRIREVFVVAPTVTATAYLATHDATLCHTYPAPAGAR
jgi:hypothetical protein